jgi:hypothetical protein
VIDPLELLTPTPVPPVAGPLRQRLLDRTVVEVRGGGRRRRLQAVGVLAGSFVAGVLTLAALLPPPPSALPVARTAPKVVADAVAPTVTAVDLEWQALERPTQAAALYRRAGDDYLRRAAHADALRCYGNALDEGTPHDLEVTSDDSWLLIAIKHARKKEMNACARE